MGPNIADFALISRLAHTSDSTRSSLETLGPARSKSEGLMHSPKVAAQPGANPNTVQLGGFPVHRIARHMGLVRYRRTPESPN